MVLIYSFLCHSFHHRWQSNELNLKKSRPWQITMAVNNQSPWNHMSVLDWNEYYANEHQVCPVKRTRDFKTQVFTLWTMWTCEYIISMNCNKLYTWFRILLSECHHTLTMVSKELPQILTHVIRIAISLSITSELIKINLIARCGRVQNFDKW